MHIEISLISPHPFKFIINLIHNYAEQINLKYRGDNFFYIVNSFLILYIHVDKLYTFSMEILKINTELQQA